MTTESLLQVLLVFISAYFIGAIPFGAWVGRLYGIDLLKVGSGSTGTTNVMRALGFWPGLIVLLGDIGKGTLATYLGMVYLHLPVLVVLSGIIAMLAHSHSIFLGFKGGKSAATGAGVLLALSWQMFIIVFFIVVITLVLTRYQSLASLLGSGAAPILMYFFGLDRVYVFTTAIGVLFIWIKHIPNMKRLLSGTESKIGSKVHPKRSRKK